MSKVQLRHPSLVDHNQFTGMPETTSSATGEWRWNPQIKRDHLFITLIFSEINFLSHLYFQGRGGREGRRSRNVRRGGRTSRSRKGQKQVCTQPKYGDGDIYPRKAEYQRISFITYTANYQTLGWHWSHQIHPLKRWFKFASKVLIFVIFILLYIIIYCTLKWCRWIHIREGDESPNLVWESSRAQLIRLVARNMLILADFVQTTIRI